MGCQPLCKGNGWGRAVGMGQDKMVIKLLLRLLVQEMLQHLHFQVFLHHLLHHHHHQLWRSKPLLLAAELLNLQFPQKAITNCRRWSKRIKLQATSRFLSIQTQPAPRWSVVNRQLRTSLQSQRTHKLKAQECLLTGPIVFVVTSNVVLPCASRLSTKILLNLF